DAERSRKRSRFMGAAAVLVIELGGIRLEKIVRSESIAVGDRYSARVHFQRHGIAAAAGITREPHIGEVIGGVAVGLNHNTHGTMLPQDAVDKLGAAGVGFAGIGRMLPVDLQPGDFLVGELLVLV